MGWSAGNEQTTGAKGSGKTCGEEGKARDVSAAPQTREDRRKWVCQQIGAGWSMGRVGWDGMELQGAFHLQGGGTAPGRMEDLIRLCLSLQSEFSDFPPFPSGTGKLPGHLSAVFGSGEHFEERSQGLGTDSLQHPGFQPCSQGSVSGSLALLSGHSSHPCLCSLPT